MPLPLRPQYASLHSPLHQRKWRNHVQVRMHRIEWLPEANPAKFSYLQVLLDGSDSAPRDAIRVVSVTEPDTPGSKLDTVADYYLA